MQNQATACSSLRLNTMTQQQDSFLVEVDRACTVVALDDDVIQQRLADVLRGEGAGGCEISVSIIGHQAMHELNVRYLSHDYPTDVLSFRLDEREDDLSFVEGEVIVSAEMAIERAEEFGWSSEHEMMYYLLHGTLHLCGYDDHSPANIFQMRQREAFYLDAWGLTPQEFHTKALLASRNV